MPRQPKPYREIHTEADKLEPRMETRVRRALERTRERVQINTLANLLAAGDVRAVLRLLPAKAVREDMEPVKTVVREAFARGGREGAKMVREVVE